MKRVNQLDSSIKMLMASQSNPLSMRRKSSIAMVSLPRLGSGKLFILTKSNTIKLNTSIKTKIIVPAGSVCRFLVIFGPIGIQFVPLRMRMVCQPCTGLIGINGRSLIGILLETRTHLACGDMITFYGKMSWMGITLEMLL